MCVDTYDRHIYIIIYKVYFKGVKGFRGILRLILCVNLPGPYYQLSEEVKF